jgi:thiol-disulfide isomerase/thioredoxin
MSKIKKIPLLVASIAGYLAILLTFSGSVTPAYGQDSVRMIPSLGKGPYEVMMFADYFCPPCRAIDSKAEPLFKELLATGKVRITFIDVPFSRATPIYAKYYLYAVNDNSDAKSVLHVRKVLFDAAQVKRIWQEDALMAYLKDQKISWKAMNEKSIFPLLDAHIKENKIDQTPTCAIKYSATDVKKYLGADEIWEGLTKLKAHLGSLKK